MTPQANRLHDDRPLHRRRICMIDYEGQMTTPYHLRPWLLVLRLKVSFRLQ